MILKSNRSPSIKKRRGKIILDFIANQKWSILFVIINIVLSLSISYTLSSKSFRFSLKQNYSHYSNFFLNPLQSLHNFYKGVMSSEYNSIYIDIKFEDKKKLDFLSKISSEGDGNISEQSKLYVPAKITHNKNKYKAEIRLKGDWGDHTLREKKRSYRVKLKNQKTLFGMRKFSLQHPDVRGYLYEWFCHKIFKQEEIIGLRYDFIKVYLNGDDYGIFAIEEHFDKRLVENNKRKESPIIRFDENNFFREFREFYNHNDSRIGYNNPSGYGSFNRSPIRSFKSFINSEDSLLTQNLKVGHSLLESFREKKIKPSDAFNIEKLASYLAIVQVLRGYHGANWRNIRFYYNPFTMNLEPIAFDMYDGSIEKNFNLFIEDEKNGFFEILFSDNEFYKTYVKKLEKYSDKIYLDTIFFNFKKDLNRVNNILYSEWPSYFFDKSKFYDNANYIRSIINPAKAIRVEFLQKDNKLIELEITNLQRMKIEIGDVRSKDKIVYKNSSKDKVINGLNHDSNIEKLIINYIKESDDHSIDDSLFLEYKILGLDNVRIEKITKKNALGIENLKIHQSYKIGNVDDFSFVIKNELDKKITFNSDSIIIDRDIIIPSGYEVLIKNGAFIDMINSSSIISYSNIICKGLENKRITFTSSDNTGQGISVISTNSVSKFKFVDFENLQAVNKPFYSLTSSLTFYQSNVHFYNCSFSKNLKGDDLLNIVRSQFFIENSIFDYSFADALDIDFAEGSINNVRFNYCGNDCLDISGSDVDINNIVISHCRDKGISAGENTRLIGSNIKVNSSEIAICSKDLSLIELNGAIINDSNIGFTAFQKKPEFGPGYLSLNNISFSSVNNEFFIETESSCLVDGYEANQEKIDNVESLYYGAKYGRASK